MPHTDRKLALIADPPVPLDGTAAALHRRRQRVVVRAPGNRAPVEAPADRRQHFPTLSGLGFRDEADTVPAIDGSDGSDASDDGETTPVSCVRARVAPAPTPARRTSIPKAARSLILPPRTRPVTLLDDVDDDVARKYREDAERLLASGIFDDYGDAE